MTIVISILSMLLILSILTIAHEFGHYIVGRIFKVKILEFSVFMGPKIFQHTSKKTGIKYSLRCLPIGGYCAFEGEENEESPDSLSAKPWYVRMLLLSAGAIMNILLALVMVIIIFSVTGFQTTVVSNVNDDYVMAFTDVEAGDRLIKYDGRRVFTKEDYDLFNEYDEDIDKSLTFRKKDGKKVTYFFEKTYSKSEDGKTANMKINVYSVKGSEKTLLGTIGGVQTDGKMIFDMISADGKKVTRDYTFVFDEETGYAKDCTVIETHTGDTEEGNVKEYAVDDLDATVRLYGFDKYGFSFSEEKGNVFKIIGGSFRYLLTLTRSVYLSLFWLISGKVGVNAVTGPVGLTSVVTDVVAAEAAVKEKILALISMAALISANLGVVNMLPFPALDGGKFFLIIIELLRKGKKLDPKKEGILNIVGFVFLMLLGVLVAGKDIVALIKGKI